MNACSAAISALVSRKGEGNGHRVYATAETHTSPRAGEPTGVNLNTKEWSGNRNRDRWIVRVAHENGVEKPRYCGTLKRLHHAEHHGRYGNGLRRRWLTEGGSHLRRGVATILRILIALMTRVATHFLAAAHRVLRSRHAQAVRSVCR